jgi:hypothetical protein
MLKQFTLPVDLLNGINKKDFNIDIELEKEIDVSEESLLNSVKGDRAISALYDKNDSHSFFLTSTYKGSNYSVVSFNFKYSNELLNGYIQIPSAIVVGVNLRAIENEEQIPDFNSAEISSLTKFKSILHLKDTIERWEMFKEEYNPEPIIKLFQSIDFKFLADEKSNEEIKKSFGLTAESFVEIRDFIESNVPGVEDAIKQAANTYPEELNSNGNIVPVTDVMGGYDSSAS